MKRNFISRLLMFVTILTVLYSCRNDYFPEKENNKNTGKFNLTSKTISLNESKHKSILISELNKAETELKSRKTDASGKVVNYGNGVSIDTDHVIYIENGPNYHTYTFKINRENAPVDAPIENLLLSPLPDGTYREFLVIYNFTEQEKIAYLSGYGVDRKGKMTVMELEKGTYGNPLSKESCGYQTVDVYIPCYTGDHHGGNVGSWGGCNWQSAENGFPPQHYSFVALVCSGDSETIGGSNPIDGGGSGSNGGGTTPCSQPNDPPCEITPPTSPEPGLTDENGCPIGTPTLPNLGITKNTPCEKVKTENNRAKIFLGKPLTTQRKIDITTGIDTATEEKGFSFGVDKTTGEEMVTSIKIGTGGTSVNLVALSNIFDVIGGAHTHLSDGYYVPSTGDAYAFIQANVINPKFQYYYAFAPNNNHYVLTITNPTNFATFTTNYPASTHFDPDTNAWNSNEVIGIDFDYAVKYFMSQGKPEQDAWDYAMSYVLNKYNSGMALSKADSNGDFNPIFINEKIIEISNPNIPGGILKLKTYEKTENCNLK